LHSFFETKDGQLRPTVSLRHFTKGYENDLMSESLDDAAEPLKPVEAASYDHFMAGHQNTFASLVSDARR
jgi:hypothetical protein